MRVGLALSGGAARGIAHIGVIRYLEERGIKPCCIAGTSAGSIVGAFYCAGLSVEEMRQIVSRMSWKALFKIGIPRKGLIDSNLLLHIIEKHIGDITFEQLEIPLIINAVDLLSGEEVILDKGPVAQAVQASCAIPGIFTPVRLNRRLLVDGGLLDNVPVLHMEGRRIDLIIAVDVAAQQPLPKEPGNIFEILFQSYYIIHRHRDIKAHRHADVLIKPDLGDITVFDSGKTEELIERGYEAARLALGEKDLTGGPGLLDRIFGKKRRKEKRK